MQQSLSPSSYRPLLITVGVFAAVALFVYGSSLGNDFVRWDDHMLIFENAAIRSITPESLKQIFTMYDPELYIPLTFLSYQIDYLIGGTNPVIYHLHNLILHTLNGLGVAWLVFLLYRKKWMALFCGLLFLVHPLHTEAVAWASARKDVLSTLYFLLSLVMYLLYQRRKGELRIASVAILHSPFALLIASLFFFLLALLAKVTVVTLPVLLLLIDWQQRRPWSKWSLLDKIPYVALSFVFGVIALFGKSTVLPRLTWVDTVLMAFKSTAFYLEKLFVPIDLSVLYPYVGKITIASPDFFVPVLVVALASIYAVLSLRYTRSILFGWLFFIIAIAPTFINFEKVDIYFASDRYAYAGSIGIIVLIGLFFATIALRGRTIAWAVAILLCGAFGFLAHVQAQTWKDTEHLFTNVLKLYPYSHVAHTNIGNAYRRSGEIQKAIEHYRSALAIAVRSRTLANLASAYRQLNRTEDAISLYTQALELDPTNAFAYLGMGIIHAQRGEVELAFASYDQAIVNEPDLAEAYVNRGALFAALKQYDQAVAEYDKAITINPFSAQAHYNRGVALSKIGRMNFSMQAYEKAVELEPSFVAAHINLGLAYYDRRRIEEAVQQFEAVLQYDPGNTLATSALQQIAQKLKE